ncbi:hypothetical protein INT43_003489 [Umbelopsis isabellina]|uniref:SEC7 domain-containing protein n=1 Tax=Mortierella isabellina TaxID=91625 RepID=A0A8H7UAD2_MORIS|nr:hypothetical protein INT43_003489 [Umbelopsis isabellina]
MSSPQDQQSASKGHKEKNSASSRGSLSQRRTERGVDVPVSFSNLRRQSTVSIGDAYSFENYAFGGVSPVMGNSFSTISEDRAYFVPSPYDQRNEYLSRNPSLRSPYEREQRSKRWNRQSDYRYKDGVQEYQETGNQRDTETEESDIEMPDDELTGMSPVETNPHLSRSPNSSKPLSSQPPPQLPFIKPETFSLSFNESLNSKFSEGNAANTPLNSAHTPPSAGPEMSKLWLKSLQQPETIDPLSRWNSRNDSSVSESPVSQASPKWLKDDDALAKMKNITSGLRDQSLGQQSDSNKAQRNVDSFFNMAKAVTSNPQPTMPITAAISRPRSFLLQSAVFQVINSNTVKDRYLFLFNDLLFIAKPIMDESIMGGHPPTNARTMSEDSLTGVKFGDGHKHRFRPNENSLFQVKNIVELSKVTLYVTRDYEAEPIHLKTNADGQVILPPPRKIHPILASALRKFESDPDRAIAYLMEKKILDNDPMAIANFLFKTADLNRRQLGRYISNPDNSNVFHAFLDCFRLQGIRLDEALRTFLITFRLPSKYDSLTYIISTFAKKWYDTNQNVVKFHEDMIVKVIFAMLKLNSAIWHDMDADQDVFTFATERREQRQEKGANAAEQIDSKQKQLADHIPTKSEFMERWSMFDQYNLVPKEFMFDMYDSIREEKLETGWDHKYQIQPQDAAGQQESELIISVLPHRLPTRLTKGIPSPTITIYIPEPDPGLQIKLRGQDLVCEPSVLDFTHSRVQNFTITGSTLGRTSLMFVKVGARAGRYVSPALPRTKAIVVERSFMRHTFQIGFYQTDVKDPPFDAHRSRNNLQPPTHHGNQDIGDDQENDHSINVHTREVQRTKRKYMFSVESEESLRDWVSQLQQFCGHVNREGHHQISSKDTAVKTPEELVALQVLKEALLADEAKRSLIGLRSITKDKRASLLSVHTGDGILPTSEVGSPEDVNNGRPQFLKQANLLSPEGSGKSLSAAAAANVVAKRGHEIVKLGVQNSLMPTMLNFLRHGLEKS